MPDTAKPIIAQSQISEDSGAGDKTIKVRIHDNKSPNMPQNWNKVFVLVENDTLPLQWYGENLWSATIDSPHGADKIKICATDAAGNTACATLSAISLLD